MYASLILLSTFQLKSRGIHGGGHVITFPKALSASINRNSKWTYILSTSCALQNSYSYKHMAIKTHPKWIFLKLNWSDVLGRFFFFISLFYYWISLTESFERWKKKKSIILHRINTKISGKKTSLLNRF